MPRLIELSNSAAMNSTTLKRLNQRVTSGVSGLPSPSQELATIEPDLSSTRTTLGVVIGISIVASPQSEGSNSQEPSTQMKPSSQSVFSTHSEPVVSVVASVSELLVVASEAVPVVASVSVPEPADAASCQCYEIHVRAFTVVVCTRGRRVQARC